ncbi:putative ATPase [Microcystis phage Mel-JY01]
MARKTIRQVKNKTKNNEDYDFEDVVVPGFETDGIKEGRTKYKNPIKFKISLNEEQKNIKSKVLQETISVFLGKAGSGKTLLATQIALQCLLAKEVERIIITRPTVSDEDLGFLPGEIKDKMEPWINPIVANLTLLKDTASIQRLMAENIIEIAPISYLRGRTFLNSYVIVDETQNVTRKQLEMILTRLGTNSKMILTGDVTQIDLRRTEDSGMPTLIDMAGKVDGLGVHELTANHRNEIVEQILKYFDEHKKK